MKEYKIQCKEVNKNDDRWWNVGDYFYSLDDAKKRVEVEKSCDKYNENSNWEYRILVREVYEWKVTE